MTNLTDAEEKYEALRRWHTPSSRNGAVDWCVIDGVDWPCLTAQALDELAMLRVSYARLRAMYVGEPHQDDCLVDYECSCGQSARLKDGDA